SPAPPAVTPAPAPPAPQPAAPAPAAALPLSGPAQLAHTMVAAIVAGPVALTPDERFLCGHYLAYLLAGSRRRRLFLTPPLDPINADRARLLLAITWVLLEGGSDETIARAAELLDRRPEVRTLLSPVVVAKYLVFRSTPEKRRWFREARRRLQEASA